MTHMDQSISTYCGVPIKWNGREYQVTDDKTGITYLFHTRDEAERMTAKLNGGPIIRRLALLCDRLHHMDTDPNTCGWHRRRVAHS